MQIFWKLFAEELYQSLNWNSTRINDWFNVFYKYPIPYTKKIEETMSTIGKYLGFGEHEIKISKQHHRIDCSFGKYKDNIFNIEYAIEHENDNRTWYQELDKLRKMNQKIKRVIIAYYHWRSSSLEIVKKDLQRQYNNNELNGINENFLFIFGPWFNNNAAYDINTIKNLDYKAFIFNGINFENLNDNQILRRL